MPGAPIRQPRCLAPAPGREATAEAKIRAGQAGEDPVTAARDVDEETLAKAGVLFILHVEYSISRLIQDHPPALPMGRFGRNLDARGAMQVTWCSDRRREGTNIRKVVLTITRAVEGSHRYRSRTIRTINGGCYICGVLPNYQAPYMAAGM